MSKLLTHTRGPQPQRTKHKRKRNEKRNFYSAQSHCSSSAGRNEVQRIVRGFAGLLTERSTSRAPRCLHLLFLHHLDEVLIPLSLSLSTRRGARCTSRTALRGVRRGTLDTACGSPSTEAGTSSGIGDRTVSPLSSDQYSRAAPVLLVVSFLWTIATLHHPSSSSHRSTPCKSRTCSRRYRRPQQQHRRRLLPPPPAAAAEPDADAASGTLRW